MAPSILQMLRAPTPMRQTSTPEPPAGKHVSEPVPHVPEPLLEKSTHALKLPVAKQAPEPAPPGKVSKAKSGRTPISKASPGVPEADLAETDTPPKSKSNRKRAVSKVVSEAAATSAAAAKRSKVPEPLPEKNMHTPVPPSLAPAIESALGGENALDPAPAGDYAQTCELKVGSLNYTCLCTRDAVTAGAWAELVARDVDAAAQQLGSAVDILGMDCEWAAPWHRGPGIPDRLATVQIFHHGSSGRRALVFSVAGLGGKLPSSVAALLGDARLAKVGVNIGGDASRLVRDFGCPVRGLYDLSNLNKKPKQKVRKSVSLEDLVRTHCPEDMHIAKAEAALDKGVRTGNWESWPLSAEQIAYAADDAALGVMAFMHRFGLSGSDRQLSKDALEALVELEEVNSDTLAKKNDATSKKRSASEAESSSTGAKESKAALSKKETGSTGEVESTPTGAKKPKADHQHFFMAMRNSVVKAPNIGKKDHPQGPKNALAGVCIVVSGVLDSFERADMEQYVKDHGGNVSKSVTSKVTHLVTDHGEAGPSKLAKCKELGIPSVSEDVILKMVSDKLGK